MTLADKFMIVAGAIWLPSLILFAVLVWFAPEDTEGRYG
jgi:hypothetical protein